MVNRDSIDRLAGIAREAGAEILARASGGGATDLKADRSPVTEADRAAHRAIIAALAEWDSSIPVLSEEGEIPPHEIRLAWRRFWLVDPLDGTKEFLSRNGEYTVNIALVEDEAPVMGVVYAPAIGLAYMAGRGLGAWKRVGESEPVPIHSSPPAPGVSLVIAESRSHPSAELEDFLRTVPVKARVRAGSSLKFCWVAEGRADLYPRFGPTMEWDTAAGDCVFRQSGRDEERRSPLRYNTASLRHDRFVIGW
jgi:3'(2'), 5'-bisphosphate nucleotidase